MQFVIGFLSTFVLLGASVSGIGQIGQEQRPLLQRVGGVLILVCGLALLVGSARVGLPRTWAPLGRWTRLGRGSPVALGAAFALYWTPCATPILASILTLAATSGSPARGVGLLCCYAFGLGVPFVAVALGSNEALVAFRHMRRAGRAIEAVSGLVLLVTALALLTGGRLPLQ
jgi:cytochrome c-type biogenesis protein